MRNMEMMRTKIMSVYPFLGWQEKVRKMKDNQVIAIYYKFLSEGKFDKKGKKKEKNNSTEYYQYTLYDIFGDNFTIKSDKENKK